MPVFKNEGIQQQQLKKKRKKKKSRYLLCLENSGDLARLGSERAVDVMGVGPPPDPPRLSYSHGACVCTYIWLGSLTHIPCLASVGIQDWDPGLKVIAV